MSRTFHKISFYCAVSLVSCAAAGAQELNKFTFNAGVGFTQPVGATSRRLDTGFTLGAGGGYNFTDHIGLNLGFDYTQMGIGSNTLTNIGFPGGDVHIWDFTLDPVVRFRPH